MEIIGHSDNNTHVYIGQWHLCSIRFNLQSWFQGRSEEFPSGVSSYYYYYVHLDTPCFDGRGRAAAQTNKQTA